MTGRKVALLSAPHLHPMYREQLEIAPDGWDYVAPSGVLEGDVAPKLVSRRSSPVAAVLGHAEAATVRVLAATGYVHRIRERADPSVALVHAFERLPRRPRWPTVVDFEHVLVFVLYQQRALDRPWGRRRLVDALLDERLRFLLPWTEFAHASVLGTAPADARPALAAKSRVVMPAIRSVVDRPARRGDGPLRLLFVGTQFLEKGGADAVAAVREARREADVTLDVVSYAPPPWDRVMADEPGVTYHAAGMPFAALQALFGQAHALLFPSHMDTYGYVALEAMAHGLPVIAPRHAPCRETVLDGRSGLLFKAENMVWSENGRCRFDATLPFPRWFTDTLAEPSEQLVRAIAACIVRLATETGLHSELAAGALESVETGHLSPATRRSALAEVYESAAA